MPGLVWKVTIGNPSLAQAREPSMMELVWLSRKLHASPSLDTADTYWRTHQNTHTHINEKKLSICIVNIDSANHVPPPLTQVPVFEC